MLFPEVAGRVLYCVNISMLEAGGWLKLPQELCDSGGGPLEAKLYFPAGAL